MKSEIKILMVEDDENDAELIQRQLRRDGLQFACTKVCTREEFLKELESRSPDIIFSDHGLPAFSGCEARALARKFSPQTPFVFVTGGIGEVQPGEFSEPGTDYVLKNELSKLPNLVRQKLQARTLADSASSGRQSTSSLKAHRAVHCTDRIVESGIILIDHRGTVMSWNRGAMRLLGHAPFEIIGEPFACLFPWRAVERRFVDHLLEMALREGGFKGELLLLRKNSAQLWAEVSIHPVRLNPQGPPTGCSIVIQDLTERSHSPGRPSVAVREAFKLDRPGDPQPGATRTRVEGRDPTGTTS